MSSRLSDLPPEIRQAVFDEARRQEARERGFARAAALSPERRREIARMGGRAAAERKLASQESATMEQRRDARQWAACARPDELRAAVTLGHVLGERAIPTERERFDAAVRELRRRTALRS
jgi:general stress protein YciG